MRNQTNSQAGLWIPYRCGIFFRVRPCLPVLPLRGGDPYLRRAQSARLFLFFRLTKSPQYHSIHL